MAIIDWNGTEIPETLRRLPAGRYVIERVDELPSLTPDEEEGLIRALDSLRAGRGVPHDEVRSRLLPRDKR